MNGNFPSGFGAHAWQSIFRTGTAGSSDGDKCFAIYAIHECDLMSNFHWGVLVDTISINPQVLETQILCHCQGIFNGERLAQRYIISETSSTLVIAPDIAKSGIL